MNRLYVLQRKDFPFSYQAVQAGHSVAEFLLRGPITNWDNGTLVYLGVKDENELKDWVWKLEIKNIPYTIFREPDIGDEITSIATVCDGKIFKKLNLL